MCWVFFVPRIALKQGKLSVKLLLFRKAFVEEYKLKNSEVSQKSDKVEITGKQIQLVQFVELCG